MGGGEKKIDIKIGNVFCNSKVMSSVICVPCSCGCVIPAWGMLLQVQHRIYGQFKPLFLLILTNPKGMVGSVFTGLMQWFDLEKSLEMSPYTLLLFLKRHRHYHKPCSIIHTHYSALRPQWKSQKEDINTTHKID